MDLETGHGWRQRLDAAIALREDGDFEDSAAAFEALLAAHPADPEATLEYVKTLRRLDRTRDADLALEQAILAHPGHFELRKAWAEMPRLDVDYAATLARGRVLRSLFSPHDHPGAWETLSVEFDSLYEMGEWDRLEALVAAQWDQLCAVPEILPDGVAALHKLFLTDRLRDLAEAARPQAWERLPPGAAETLVLKAQIARRNRELMEATGISLISIGQNCLPYQLAGRWGLVAPQADPADLTPFDLGGFTNDSVAGAIESDFAAFEDRGNFTVTKAWGGGQMFLHKPSNVGFFHERGTHWVTPDQSRFFMRLALMIANWKRRRKAAKRLYVYCLCGAGSLDRLVAAAAAKLLGPGAQLLILDVMQQPSRCPPHGQVTYRHIPYPKDYDWTSVYQQCSARGFAFEAEVIGAIAGCLTALDPAAAALLHPAIPADRPTPPADEPAFSSAELIETVWSFGNRNGNLLGEAFRFGAGGMIEVYRNDNEASWRYDGGRLEIFKQSGELMWTSAAMLRDGDGRRQIVLRTHLNADLEFVLTETARAQPAVAGAFTGRLKILLLDNGLGIQARLPKALAGAEIVTLPSIGEIDRHSGCNVFISGLLLSHAPDARAAAALVARIARHFPLAIFFELSAYNSDYLASFGLESYHRAFQENQGMDALSLDLVANAAAPANVYKVELYADMPAFDSFKPWVIARERRQPGMPSAQSRGDYRVFDRPVFEIAAYACHKFDALDLDLEADLTLLETRSLRLRAQSSGLRLDHIARPAELGQTIYATQRDLPAALKNRIVSLPATLWNDPAYAVPEHEAVVAAWRAEFKIEIADVFIYDLPNCIYGGAGSIVSNGVFVWGTDYLLPYLNSSSLDPILRGMQKRHPKQHVSGAAIAGFNALYDNYSHCVSESMASISLCLDVLRQRGADRVTIVTGKHRAFGRQHLEILLQGEPNIEIVELDRDEFITCDRLLYCDNLGPLTPPRVVLEKAAYIDKIIAHCGLRNAVPHRRIYLARTDTKGRAVLNEADLIAGMTALGFQIFIASAVPVTEQIRTFREASFVVGPHGAGLTNVAFQQSGSILLELIQSSYLNTGLMRLAQIANVRYYSEMFFPDGAANPDQSWTVDVERVLRVVRELLEVS
jgi:hypothetical protein